MSDERPMFALKFALLGDFIHFVQADSNIYTPKRIMIHLHTNTEVVWAGIVQAIQIEIVVCLGYLEL